MLATRIFLFELVNICMMASVWTVVFPVPGGPWIDKSGCDLMIFDTNSFCSLLRLGLKNFFTSNFGSLARCSDVVN